MHSTQNSGPAPHQKYMKVHISGMIQTGWTIEQVYSLAISRSLFMKFTPDPGNGTPTVIPVFYPIANWLKTWSPM